MSKKIRDTKLRTLIKAYLVFHRGKRCTAKEISEWINGNSFCMNKTKVNPNVIARLIYAGRYAEGQKHIFGDVHCEKVYNLTYYWVNK